MDKPRTYGHQCPHGGINLHALLADQLKSLIGREVTRSANEAKGVIVDTEMDYHRGPLLTVTWDTGHSGNKYVPGSLIIIPN